MAKNLSSELPDITDLLLQAYLAQSTGITNWLDFSPNLGIANITTLFRLAADVGEGDTTIAVNNGAGGVPELLQLYDKFTIVGDVTEYEITNISVGSTTHTYTISPAINFDAVAGTALAIVPPLRYAGCIWPQAYQRERNAIKARTTSDTRWGIRLLISNQDSAVVSRQCTRWATFLDDELLAAGTGVIPGTYDGVVVPSGTTIAISVIDRWIINIEENDAGGAIGRVQTIFTVKN